MKSALTYRARMTKSLHTERKRQCYVDFVILALFLRKFDRQTVKINEEQNHEGKIGVQVFKRIKSSTPYPMRSFGKSDTAAGLASRAAMERQEGSFSNEVSRCRVNAPSL